VSRYVVSPEARADLEEASRYGDAAFGVTRTDRDFAELDRVFGLVADFPQLARERTEFDPPVRIHRHGRHYIVYCVMPGHVRIVRVLREETDLGHHLRRILWMMVRPLHPRPETL
jgi:toxin ParE1/3/4